MRTHSTLHRHTLLIAAVAFGLAAGLPARPALADERLDRVKAGWAESLAAVRTVQCTYHDKLNVLTEGRYWRDGERFYYAVLGSAFGEASWDGKEARIRSSPGFFQIRDKPEDAQAGVGIHEYAFGHSSAIALGLKRASEGNDTYSFVESADEQVDGVPCIRLTFTATPPGQPRVKQTLSSWHSPADGYWPIRITYSDPGGRLLAESTLTYHHRKVDGVALVYPHIARTLTHDPDDPTRKGNDITVTVDLDTLVLNAPIPPERFRIEPNPNDMVWNEVTRKQIPAGDPNWDYTGDAPWPWTKLVRHMRERKANPPPPPVPGQPIAAIPGSPTRTVGVLNTWTLAGLAVLLGVAGWAIYQRRRAA